MTHRSGRSAVVREVRSCNDTQSRCIHVTWVCDIWKDCPNGQDEDSCEGKNSVMSGIYDTPMSLIQTIQSQLAVLRMLNRQKQNA